MDTSEIGSFLAQVKAALSSNNFNILDQRRKYLATLSQLGIVEQDVIDDLMDLTVSECWKKAPDKDPAFSGDVWQCKKILHGKCIYIKLKIQPSPKGFLLVMSYHIDGM